VLRAGIVLGIETLLTAHHEDAQHPVTELQSGFDRIVQAHAIRVVRFLLAIGMVAHHEPIHNHLNRMHLVAVQGDLVIELGNLAIDARAHIACLDQVVEQALVLAFAPLNHRRQEHDTRPIRESADVVHDLLNRLPGDLSPTDRAMGNADAGIEQAQIVIDLGYCAHR